MLMSRRCAFVGRLFGKTNPVRALALAVFGLQAGILMQVTQAAPQDTAQPAALPQAIEFNRDIRPILSDKCYKCHGPGTQQADLRLDLEEAAKRELRNGRFAIVAGDVAKSTLIQRITATNPGLRMPRTEKGKTEVPPLTEAEIALLRRWIEQGAAWQKHWSFIPPVRPTPPDVSNPKWLRNPIDAFVLQRLEREGLTPSPEADPATLLRRVTLDLTGVPPTLVELDAFLKDKSPNAYEKVVDRLLRSPRYGERMAFPWLEAARYADSSGYQSDGERFMWRWRDWVIKAFNLNLPYDQFVVEQVAGDLLPKPMLDQVIATGFNRNHRGNGEGGIIPEEYAAEYVIDRVDTTSTVFLGLSAGCARCHNHKYDPITQKEFYQLYAYFNNLPEHGRARRIGNSPPFIAAPLPEQQRQLKQLDDKLAAAEASFAKLQSNLLIARRKWEPSLAQQKPYWWLPSRGLVAHFPLDGDLDAPILLPPAPESLKARVRLNPVLPTSVQASEPTPAVPPTPPIAPGQNEVGFAPGKLGQAATFDGLGFIQSSDIFGFGSHINVRTVAYDDAYTIAAWIYPTTPTGAIVTKVQDDLTADNLTTDAIGHGLNLKDGKLYFNYGANNVDEGIRLQTDRSVTLNQWHQVTLTYDGTRWASGIKVYVDGELWNWGKIFQDDMNDPAPTGPEREPLRIGAGGGRENRFRGRIDDVRIYSRALSAAEAAMLADVSNITEIAALPEHERTVGQKEKIAEYFLEYVAPLNIRDAWTKLKDARTARDDFYVGLPTVMVMQDMSPPRESHLLLRGQYDQPGEKVTPQLPAALTPDPGGFAPNRLGLARWLVDPSNPLVARVTVNRFWQMYFGVGIVKTAEDFGSQGDAPSHPELLDWLATEFIRTGWDVKGLQKTIVMSATYRQTSGASEEMLARDPENRLLGRGSYVRLTADVIRDQALAISGLLVERIGGPSVKSYQPERLWSEVGSGNYVQDHGDGLYRRSLYLFWKRTVPPPAMANFDASSREAHLVRPVVTNTPLQALNLMNDVTFVEAARVMAQRVMKLGGITPSDRIAYAFRLATSRSPRDVETEILLNAFNENLARFKVEPDDALKYVSHGEYPRDVELDTSELAAYTSVTSLILNLNELVMRK